MISDRIQYSVGPLLYCPALSTTVADLIISGKLGNHYSMALCLEDTISDNAVDQAIDQLGKTLRRLAEAKFNGRTELPKIFVRVRNPEQISRVFQLAKPCGDVFSGLIFPKYSMESADRYNQQFLEAVSHTDQTLYMMPILESGDILDYQQRRLVLPALKEKIDQVKEYVLNVRVGGNDFCKAFGVRRHIDETIYDILPVAQALTDILTVFSRDYVVSGPVWEYYAGDDGRWEEGLRRELRRDKLNGFVGKTVIHPNQIPIVAEELRPDRKDYEDAAEIMNWKPGDGLLVGGSCEKERMNEVRTHQFWAYKTVLLAELYGVKEP